MSRLSWTGLALAFVAALLLMVAPVAGTAKSKRRGKPAAGKKTKKERVVYYTGSLQNEGGSGVGGIYPLEFSLHKTLRSTKPAWSETHWVAIDNGAYSVELGRKSKISKKINLDQAFIAVAIPGAGEILREKLALGAESPEATADAPDAPPKPQQAPPVPQGEVSYAEKAGFAYEAELATNANRLEGRTFDDLKKEFEKKVKVGRKTSLSEAAGGKGGYEFEINCPKGFVVTGMSGASGLYIDSVQLICSPIE